MELKSLFIKMFTVIGSNNLVFVSLIIAVVYLLELTSYFVRDLLFLGGPEKGRFCFHLE